MPEMREKQMLLSNLKKHNTGFTLIELMIAMAIGMFLIAGVFAVFKNGRVTQDKTETQTRLIDDARFAISTLAHDLRHAGLWGKTNDFSLISGALGADGAKAKTVAAMPTIIDTSGPDCGVLWYTDLKHSVQASNGINMFAGTCIGTSDYKVGTDVVVTKFANPTTLNAADLADQVAYLYANKFQGELFLGKTAPTFLDAGTVESAKVASIHRLNARVYYVEKNTETGDDYPSLHRLDLDVGPKMANMMLLPGVDDLQIQFGIDTNKDGSVNAYVNPDDARVGKELENVKAAQIWVVLRTREQELQTGEEQTISVGGNIPVTPTDGFRRVVMSSVVMLRNRLSYATIAGGN